ncbi:MAG TPA: GTPase [Candidatus Fimimorpha excrementavium]|nr:GTPase [Candidatus Fimimorpha excrementavium]
MEEKMIPVYLITGFLEGGKTSFLNFTMSQEYFADGEKTLLIVCEEGEEEYSESMLADNNTVMATVEEEYELDEEFLKKLDRKYHPERVLIEYNGMWSVKKFLEKQLPHYWGIYQIITILDGSSFQLYLNNIKSLAMELVTYTDLVIFNRCDENTPLATYQRSVKAVNRRAQVVFEDENGEMENPEEDLPYDLEADVIEIDDRDYGIWYIDVQEHHERYEGKKVKFLAQLMTSDEFPAGLFVPGRNAMTCCADDITFLGFISSYKGPRKIQTGEWARIVVTVKWEYSAVYKEEGPVLYVSEIVPEVKPKEELIYF